MIQKTLTRLILSIATIVAVFNVIPSRAYAIDFNPFNPIDPFCLFSCDDPEPQTVYNTTDSYNTNSFNNTTYGGNSPIVNTNTTAGTGYSGGIYETPSVTTYIDYTTPATPTIINNNNNNTTGTSGGIYQTPIYTPVYTTPIVYNTPVVYTTPVYDYSYYNTPTPYYSGGIYYNSYSPLTVSCSANTTVSPLGSYVTWTAYPSGSYNYGYNYGYTYRWSGTDNIYGSQSSISTYYSTPGQKYAYVTISANGQTASAQCSNSVTVGAPFVTYSPPQYTGGVIQLACAVDTVTAKIGSPVTWNAEAYGATGRFVYSWSGTDNLYGTQSSAITSYSTPGVKSAIVTATASNGQSVSKVCKNTVTVKSATVAKKRAPVVAVQAPVAPQAVMFPPQVEQTAASLFSVANVPWGWIAVLVILVLMGMIFYLVFNKKKI